MKHGLEVLALALLVSACGCKANDGSTASGGGTTGGTPSMSTRDSASGAMSSGAGVSGGAITLPDGLKYEDLKVGDGQVAESGMKVTVNYTGWLTDGTKFDSSFDHGQPLGFTLGGGNVIRGWDEGIKGMKVGGKRKLTIPPDLGYGAAGAGSSIPPNATLVFEVELLNVQ